jgi:hypothetical protein
MAIETQALRPLQDVSVVPIPWGNARWSGSGPLQPTNFYVPSLARAQRSTFFLR